MKNNWTRATDLVVGHSVECLSVPTLLARYGIAAPSVRVVTVDADSFDVDIVDSLPITILTGLRLLVWETNIVPSHEDEARRSRLQALVDRLEHVHGFECRGWASRRRRMPLNGRCILDEENAWCLHWTVARKVHCDVASTKLDALRPRCLNHGSSR